MLQVVKTTKDHLNKIKLQPEQADEFVNIDELLLQAEIYVQAVLNLLAQ